MDRISAQITRAAHSAEGANSSRVPWRGLHSLLGRGTFTYSEVSWACQALHQWVLFPAKEVLFLIHIEAPYRLARALDMLTVCPSLWLSPAQCRLLIQ